MSSARARRELGVGRGPVEGAVELGGDRALDLEIEDVGLDPRRREEPAEGRSVRPSVAGYVAGGDAGLLVVDEGHEDGSLLRWISWVVSATQLMVEASDGLW